MANNSKKHEVFYYCFFHIFTTKLVHYHHVIFHITPEEMDNIKSFDGDEYQYCLISSMPIPLNEEQKGQLIIRGLIMDGESLLKRLKSATK